MINISELKGRWKEAAHAEVRKLPKLVFRSTFISLQNRPRSAVRHWPLIVPQYSVPHVRFILGVARFIFYTAVLFHIIIPAARHIPFSGLICLVGVRHIEPVNQLHFSSKNIFF